jgi:lysozyme family protein
MRFEQCFPIVLASEGGYVNHKSDRGGATNFGVTQRTFTSHLKGRGRTDRDVSTIKQNEVSEIYHEYWKSAKCDLLPEPLDLLVFDCAINSGASMAIKLLQQVLGVDNDGQYGRITSDALREEIRVSGIAEVCASYLDERELFFSKIVERDPPQIAFFDGWINRLDKLKRVIA